MYLWLLAMPSSVRRSWLTAGKLSGNPAVVSALTRGIDCCRQGNWNEGLGHLGWIAERESTTGLPGLFYSFLGYGIALQQHRIEEGLKLCQHAIKLEFYEVENYVNLARTCLLAKDRKGAVQAVRSGLKVDRGHEGLLALYKELGMRSQPVLPFLSRSNLLNQLLGRIRHAFRAPPAPPAPPAAK